MYFKYKINDKEYVNTDGILYSDYELANFGKSMMISYSENDPEVCMFKKKPEPVKVFFAILSVIPCLMSIFMMIGVFFV